MRYLILAVFAMSLAGCNALRSPEGNYSEHSGQQGFWEDVTGLNSQQWNDSVYGPADRPMPKDTYYGGYEYEVYGK